MDGQTGIESNPFLSGVDSKVSVQPESIGGASGIESTGDEVLDAIAQIAQNTINALSQEGLPNLPSNFELYFDKFLEKESPVVQRNIKKIMNIQSDLQERALNFEKSVGESLKTIKQILDCLSVVYQNFIVSQNIVKKYAKDMQQADNKLVFKNVMDFFEKDTNKIAGIVSTQLDQIRQLYNSADKTLKTIAASSVYDLTLDVYNKHYFLNILQKEYLLCKQFNHSSVLIYITLSKQISLKVGVESATYAMLLKTTARFLQKHIRSSDILAYLGDGLFGILLKFSDIVEAQDMCVDLQQIAQGTDIFITDSTLQLELTASLTKIMGERTLSESMSAAKSTLNIALENKEACKIYQQDDINGAPNS